MPVDPQEFEGHDVLYVGELENLRKMTDFFKGNSSRSFLRQYIGTLNYMNPVQDGDSIRFSTEDERWLSKWMKENILIFYQANPQHEKVAKLLVDELDPLLNLDHESPVWADYRKKLEVSRNTCVVDADCSNRSCRSSLRFMPRNE